MTPSDTKPDAAKPTSAETFAQAARAFERVVSPTSTPLSLEAAQEALILRFAHLKERLPKLTETAAKATTELRTLKAELEQTERTLRAMTRIRTPRHRGTSK